MKILGVQCDVTLGDVPRNLQTIRKGIEEAGRRKADLVIFPECSLTGYCFDSREEALQVAEELTGASAQAVVEACKQHDTHCLYGFLERDKEQVFNATALVGPNGVLASYRKIHLPFVGVDRFVDYGDRPFTVSEMPGLKVGMNICYDAALPEPARILMLQGADLIALPTNWPRGAECMTPGPIATRAMENKVYYAAVNRVGVEAGTTFIGQSCISGPGGEILAMGSQDGHDYLEAEIDIEKARNKRVVRQAGKFELDRIADRRPEFYSILCEPHQQPTPRERFQSGQ